MYFFFPSLVFSTVSVIALLPSITTEREDISFVLSSNLNHGQTTLSEIKILPMSKIQSFITLKSG